MVGKPSANCRVNISNSECEPQLKQINLFIIYLGRAGEERVLVIEKFYSANCREYYGQNEAYNAEYCSKVCLEIWTFLKCELHSLAEKVDRLKAGGTITFHVYV